MRFSTKTGYGLRAMIKLAENYKKGPYSLHKFAKEEKISLAYLERIMSKLKTGKLVRALKGSKGGYKLTRPPKQIKVIEIFEALDGSLSPYLCAKAKPAKCKVKKCKSYRVWAELYKSMYKTLDSMSLNELIK